MTEIVIVVPVLGRPARAFPLVTSVTEATTVPYRLVFACSPGDHAEIGACRATGADVLVVEWTAGHGDFAKKVNRVFRETTEPFLFQAADDVVFNPGWDTAALAVIEATQTGVCGTNDEGNKRVQQGKHSTHSLIRRSYVDECGGSLEGPGYVFSEAYGHQWCDTELVELAKSRDCFSFAADSVVTHLHPLWGHGEMDDTYRKGQSTSDHDHKLYLQRQRKWIRTRR